MNLLPASYADVTTCLLCPVTPSTANIWLVEIALALAVCNLVISPSEDQMAS